MAHEHKRFERLTDKVRVLAKILAKRTGKSLERVVSDYLLPELLGKPPKWSLSAGGYNIGRGAIFNSGAFCVFYGQDRSTGEIFTVLHKRKEKSQNGKHKLGAPGGYTSTPEQTYEGLAREILEEMIDINGKPAIKIDVGKLVPLFEGRDVSKKPPVQFTAYSYELTSKELKAIREYSEKFQSKNFRKAVLKASNGENFGITVVPLSKVIKMSDKKFTYHRQKAAFGEVARRLGIDQELTLPAATIGYTLDDMRETNLGPLAERVGTAASRRTHRPLKGGRY